MYKKNLDLDTEIDDAGELDYEYHILTTSIEQTQSTETIRIRQTVNDQDYDLC